MSNQTAQQAAAVQQQTSARQGAAVQQATQAGQVAAGRLVTAPPLPPLMLLLQLQQHFQAKRNLLLLQLLLEGGT
jgi:hypothetical protein